MDRDGLITQLATGAEHRFCDWSDTPIPRGPTGVYTIWNNDIFTYVGMSWKASSKGLWGRMDSHASGRRSGDQFCVYVCDRFVVPRLSRDELESIANGELRLDNLTRDYIRSELTYRFVLTETGDDARAIEAEIRASGLPHIGQPFLNPIR